MILSHGLNSIGLVGPNDLFWTIGNKEEDGKDKPILGGLSSRDFDGSTFYKIQEGSDTLFEVTTTNVSWGGGFAPPQNGEQICIELLIKNSNLDTNRGRFISFGNRTLEIGKQTSYKDFSVGFSLNNSSWSATKLYANPDWSFKQPYYLDFAYIRDSYKRYQVVAIKSYIKRVSTGIIVSCYVDDTKVFEYELIGATMSGYIGTLFSDMGKLTFGNIHIYKVSDESVL